MRVVKVTESQSAVLTLTDDEAKALIRSGRRLASDSSWWGATDDEEGPERRQRSVIRCERDSGDRWRVRVSDAVGLVAVGDLLIEVQPKIPQAHLLYLMEKGGHIPRLGEDRARAGDDRSLWDLVARWFLTEVERVLRRDLMRAYENHCDELKLIRGRVDPARTARSFYTGRIEFACEYDEFTIDNPLNRTLRAAARAVGGSPLLPWSERTRALGALARMEDVGPLRSGDTRAFVGRTTAHYQNAIALAHHILRGQGRLLEAGENVAWTFLLRTPEPVEDGIRKILSDRLGHPWTVEKRGRQAVGSKMTFNPDLVFSGGLATGDVKYSVTSKDWRRSDLYQAIAFATIYETNEAAIIGFTLSGGVAPPPIDVGQMTIRHIDWAAGSAVPPDQAAAKLTDDIATWLNGLDRAYVRVAG